MEQELREGMRAWRKLHPKATLDEIETGLDGQIAALRVQMLAETVATSKTVRGEGEVACPVCGTKMETGGQHKRKLKSYGGEELGLEREYLYCPRCGQGFFPLDRELELLPGQYTTQVYGWIARLSGWMPFAAAAQIATALLGVAVSKSSAVRAAEAVGEAYVAMQTEQAAALERCAPPAPVGAVRMVVSADGAMGAIAARGMGRSAHAMHWQRGHVDAMLACATSSATIAGSSNGRTSRRTSSPRPSTGAFPPASSVCKRPVFRNARPASPPSALSTPPSIQNGLLTRPPTRLRRQPNVPPGQAPIIPGAVHPSVRPGSNKVQKTDTHPIEWKQRYALLARYLLLWRHKPQPDPPQDWCGGRDRRDKER